MYRFFIGGLVALNLALAGVLAGEALDRPILPMGIRDCCQTAGGEEPYCCTGCCWVTNDCIDDTDCT